LRLGGAAVAGHRLLHLHRGVLADRQLVDDRGGDRRAARLAQQQRGLRVHVHEDDLDRGHLRAVLAYHLGQAVVHGLEAGRQRPAADADHAAGHVAQPRPVGVDDPEAGDAQPGVDAEDADQCRKCRTPVNTIAMPRSSAAAMTSSSRTEPPGWITATAPASTTTSRPSRKGKKASEAPTEPACARPAFSALIDAMRAESIRLICPAPTPIVAPSAQKTIAFDFTYFATRHANSRSASWAAVGAFFVTTFSSSARTSRLSAVWISSPEPTRLTSCALRPRAQSVAPSARTWSSGISSTRAFALADRTCLASSV